jgi:hypothetical protein
MPVTADPPADSASPPGAAASASAAASKAAWSVIQDNGKCLAVREMSCPAGENCNPPKPTPYPCPAGVTAFPIRITQDDSSSCTLSYREFHHIDCPPPKHCNPPPPKQITAKTTCPQ